MTDGMRVEPPAGTLGLRSWSWAQIRFHPVEPFELLWGGAVPDVVGQADRRGRFGDLIGTYYAVFYFVSRRFVDVVEEAGLTGVRFTAVPVEGNPEVSDVSLLQVTGRCGPIEKVGLEPRLRLDSIEGADFYIAPGEGFIYLSPRAAKVLTAAKLRNVLIEPLGVVLV